MHGHHHSANAERITADSDRRQLTVTLALLVSFMVFEVVAGIMADSLALISDSAHMLTDAGAIALSLGAIRLARRPPSGRYTYGLKRAEILSAQANGLVLLFLALLIVIEATRRLASPPDADGMAVIVVALVGIAVNLLAIRALAKANRESLNIEGSFQHVFTDLFAFIGTVIAGVVIVTTDYLRADAIASLLVAGLIIHSGFGLLRSSTRILLEGAPEGLDPSDIGNTLAAHPDVTEVHDLHIWEVTSGFPALSAHVLVPADSDCHATRRALEQLLKDRFGLEHTTLQVDHAPKDRLLSIERS